jgi:ComF family protein
MTIARMLRAARSLRGIALARAAELNAFVWPQRCPACGASAEAAELLCARCMSTIPRVPYTLCARCLLRGREPVGCRAHPASATHAAWLFDEVARMLVHGLKYKGRPSLARAVAGAMCEALGPEPYDLVVPVPLHAVRRRLRGYNQAAALAAAVGETLGVPPMEGLIERSRGTGPQARLPGGSRRANLAGAFRVRRPRQLRGRRILIVDDVMTTGATMDAVLATAAAAGAHARGLVLAWAQ